MLRKICTILLAALTLVVTACGGGNETNSDSGISDYDKEAIIRLAAETMEADIGVYSEEYAECLIEGVLDIATDVSWEDLADAFERDGNLENLDSSVEEPEEEEIFALSMTCAAEGYLLQDLMNDAVEDIISSGGKYGDDPYLDSLYNQCADGDDWACQTLWEESPIDSEYESFAITCGGRNCEIETPNTVPWGGGSLDLDALYADCSDGSDDACVLLSDLSPDSEIREFAKTCGGRGGDCSSFG